MENKKPLISVRNMVIEFRNKGKKFEAIKGANLDIQKGEIFAIVGESGSGKTTIGRAIMGIQPIKSGAVFFEDQLVFGSPLHLHKLNKKIHHHLKQMVINSHITSRLLNNYINEVKVDYFKYIKHLSFNVKTKETRPLTEAELHKIKYASTKTANVTFKKIYYWQEGILKSLLDIIRMQQKTIRFLDYIDKQAKDLTPEMYESIRLKLRNTHIIVRDTKSVANNIFKKIENIIEVRKQYASKQLELEPALKKIFKLIEIIIQEQLVLEDFFQKAIDSQEQNMALSAPHSKRKSYIEKYNALINVPRDKMYSSLMKYKQEYEATDARDDYFNQATYDEVCEELKNLYTNETVNFRALITYVRQFEKSLASDKPINIAKLDALVASFKESDLERKVKHYHEEVLKPKLAFDASFKELQRQCEFAWKIVRKNIMVDRDIINLWYKVERKTLDLTSEEIKDYQQLLDFLEMPSLDQVLKNLKTLIPLNKKGVRNNKKIMQMVFQDPASSLNDRMPIEQIIGEGLENFPEIYKNDETRQLYVDQYNKDLKPNQEPITLQQVDDKKVKQFITLNMLKEVGMLPEHMSRYPHEFSGGQRQRVGIARAMVMKPKLIVADEPISALDVSIRAQVLNMFKKFQEEMGLTFIFVAHDLSIVRHISTRIAVIYRGIIVEMADSEELFNRPMHPYTKALLSAIPEPDPKAQNIKNNFVYDEEKEHYDYLVDFPNFKQIINNHFVYANLREQREIINSLMDSSTKKGE
ncbi:ATP-binding cassette domain-containing protein [Spiroplasma endosymbiont of Crioceris asparagi]|uniref:ATP-binding cassette domain-containing protein n=1 Tax=Spiroplasma endosymbiont of Crioceris asparagi TaxID=3066286 RepID=UPI0030CE53F6